MDEGWIALGAWRQTLGRLCIRLSGRDGRVRFEAGWKVDLSNVPGLSIVPDERHEVSHPRLSCVGPGLDVVPAC